jgi:hypothetical protein
MRKIKLTERIFYFHFAESDDEGGSHGLLVLEPAFNFSIQTRSISDPEDFKFWFSRFAKTEEEQQDRALLSRSTHSL